MHLKRLATCFAVVIGLAGVIDSAKAGEQQMTGSFAGSLVTTQIDTNSDGMAAVLSMGRGKTNLGSVTFQNVGENAARLPAVTTCPNDNWEFPLLMGHGVVQFDDSGDLLFVKYSSGFACYNPDTHIFTTSTKGIFEGGTGQFAKATGSFETTATGRSFVADQAGHAFQSLAGQVTGTILTP